ncbi:PREDICTED: uncharacterized protein LOC108690579 [Atta colombica]|uniref:uncharacterized protein LOC108690579 n=1 Tax=Atta colombica TaxID=520822 RepID=UPI00084C8AA4|nr:PREDICTED: uncharacterized protein LOC108690579 [Atta colombica]
MAAVSFRAIFVVRWCEMSRVLTATSYLTTTRRYRKETWCRRWWHISQRSVSLSANSYSPKLNPLLMKQLKEPKATEREVKKTARVTSAEKVKTESIGELSTYLIY